VGHFGVGRLDNCQETFKTKSMVKRSSKGKPPTDLNELAAFIVQHATSEMPLNGKNPAAVALGYLGGKKGGVARAKKLTPERRAEIAKKAAQTRWIGKQE
jgi:hypothetical protein